MIPGKYLVLLRQSYILKPQEYLKFHKIFSLQLCS